MPRIVLKKVYVLELKQLPSLVLSLPCLHWSVVVFFLGQRLTSIILLRLSSYRVLQSLRTSSRPIKQSWNARGEIPRTRNSILLVVVLFIFFPNPSYVIFAMLFVKSLHLSNLVFLLFARTCFGCKDKNGVIMCNGGGSYALSFGKYLMRQKIKLCPKSLYASDH